MTVNAKLHISALAKSVLVAEGILTQSDKLELTAFQKLAMNSGIEAAETIRTWRRASGVDDSKMNPLLERLTHALGQLGVTDLRTASFGDFRTARQRLRDATESNDKNNGKKQADADDDIVSSLVYALITKNGQYQPAGAGGGPLHTPIAAKGPAL